MESRTASRELPPNQTKPMLMTALTPPTKKIMSVTLRLRKLM